MSRLIATFLCIFSSALHAQTEEIWSSKDLNDPFDGFFVPVKESGVNFFTCDDRELAIDIEDVEPHPFLEECSTRRPGPYAFSISDLGVEYLAQNLLGAPVLSTSGEILGTVGGTFLDSSSIAHALVAYGGMAGTGATGKIELRDISFWIDSDENLRIIWDGPSAKPKLIPLAPPEMEFIEEELLVQNIGSVFEALTSALSSEPKIRSFTWSSTPIEFR